MPRIYLDNAATSWPKPDGVARAVERYLREVGAPAGRSAYGEAAEVEAAVRDCRSGVAKLIGVADPRRVVFTFNGTDSLNLAIHGLLRDGDHVVTTVCEHNSVLRPLKQLEDEKRITVTRVGCDREGVVAAEDVRHAISNDTRLVAMVHASNVTGALQPAAKVGKIAREYGCRFLLDAAQTLGHLPIDVDGLNVDLLAAPGHKGLLGPLGTGVLYVRDGIENELRSLRQGGTGSQSEEDRQPRTLPDKYESGNHNVPGLVGLKESVGWLRERGVAAIREHEMKLTQQLLDGLGQIAGVTVYGPRDVERRVGVVSITIAGFDPQEVAAMLDASARIQVRSGLHCAPLMHRALGTLDGGGTVRFSIGPFNTPEEVAATLKAVQEIAASPA